MRLHLLLHAGLLLSTFLACFLHGLACSSTSSTLTGTMADFLPAFDLNVRLEDARGERERRRARSMASERRNLRAAASSDDGFCEWRAARRGRESRRICCGVDRSRLQCAWCVNRRSGSICVQISVLGARTTSFANLRISSERHFFCYTEGVLVYPADVPYRTY
jgi:hypothetical protein